MTNLDKQVHDQAHLLRSKMEETKLFQENDTDSNLPPRSTVHKNKPSKLKWKIKYPVVRLLAIFFILLPVTLLSIYYFRSDGESRPAVVSDSNEHGVEYIEIDNSDSKETLKMNKPEENLQNNDSISNQELSQNVNKDLSSKNATQKPPVEKQKKSIIVKKQQSHSTNVAQYVIKYHTVRTKETLFSISMYYYHNKYGVQTIQKWNHLKGTEIFVGQKLKIPFKK